MLSRAMKDVVSAAAREEVLYRVSPEGRILEVGGAWGRFARDNGAPQLVERSPVGTRLLDHVEGAQVREFLERLFDGTRRREVPVELSYRCDGPGLRRFGRLRLEPGADGIVDVHSWIEREEPRAHLDLLSSHALRSPDLVSICAWCQRVMVGPLWLEIEEAIRRMDVLAREPVPALTHTICPSCFREVE